jgi:XRE family aerobic/anaerobic benzoate catabolism transcriptional regulator
MDDLEPTPSDSLAAERASPVRDPFLLALGERVRALRARRGMTRRALSIASDVSERHLANLELGVGNASVLVLKQVAQAIGCQLAELLGDETASAPEWLLIRDLLRGRSDAELRQGRLALTTLFGQAGAPEARAQRIALIGAAWRGQIHLGQDAGRGDERAIC